MSTTAHSAGIFLIDGLIGEGGGQVLRSCLTLSLITGKALQIRNIVLSSYLNI